jgi:hypothetical protein
MSWVLTMATHILVRTADHESVGVQKASNAVPKGAGPTICRFLDHCDDISPHFEGFASIVATRRRSCEREQCHLGRELQSGVQGISASVSL